MAQDGSRPAHLQEGGGGWGWIVGLAVIAALLFGGYYAWKNFGPAAQPPPEAADFAAPSEEPAHAAPVPLDQGAAPDTAPLEESQSASTATRTASSAPPVRRRPAPPAPPPPIPEEVIGVAPVGAPVGAPGGDAVDDNEINVAAPRPVWSRRPSERRLSALYPERALEFGREGEASLRCTVLGDGALDCARVSETPARSGFGAAALRVARLFRHGSKLPDGRDASGSELNLRVIFRLADERDRRRRR